MGKKTISEYFNKIKQIATSIKSTANASEEFNGATKQINALIGLITTTRFVDGLGEGLSMIVRSHKPDSLEEAYTLPDAGDILYSCSGLCRCAFHYACLGVSRAVMQELKRPESPLLWMCQDCRSGSNGGWAGMRDLITNTLADIKRELGETLERHLALLPQPLGASQSSTSRKQQYAFLPATSAPGPSLIVGTHTPTGPVSLSQPNRTHAGDMVATNTAKRRLIARSPPDSDPTPRIVQGTATIDESLTLLTVPPRFWLYLTRIAPSVSDEVVDSLVKRQLGTEDVIIRKLVNKDRDLSTATFVSFNVGMSLHVFEP